MSDKERLSELELAALLCSKVCHDVINPVGAIANGLEVLEEDDDQMRDIALDLIKKSAGQASARLQFARIAFGAASSSGKAIDVADAQKLALGFLDGDRVSVDWQAPQAMFDKDLIKLLLNLFLVALHVMPRGGQMDVVVGPDPENPDFSFVCTGNGARIPKADATYFTSTKDHRGIDTQSIQPYYAALIAEACGVSVDFNEVAAGEKVIIRARRVTA